MPHPDLTGATWRKSSRSAANVECVEVARVPGLVGVRDSKYPTGPVLAFPTDSWISFTTSR